VFDLGEEYEFEIIKDDDGDGSLTLSIRKIQVRNAFRFAFATRRNCPRPSNASLFLCVRGKRSWFFYARFLRSTADPSSAPSTTLRTTQLEAAWDRCREQQAADEAVNSMVLSVNRGGLLVEVEHLRGFVPQSHIAVRVPNREDLVGQTIPVKFLEVDEEKNRLVMSNRLATDVVSGEGLGVGDVCTGVVQAVKPYGAFVDVGGVSGLLHISQISHDRIVAVENVLAPGDELKVLILSKDAERGRLSLSTKKLEPSPGDMLRNPALVFEKAEEMGRTFRERVAAAEAAAQAEEGATSEMAGMEAKASADEGEEA
jgi:small subunit ribosomal protein S1